MLRLATAVVAIGGIVGLTACERVTGPDWELLRASTGAASAKGGSGGPTADIPLRVAIPAAVNGILANQLVADGLGAYVDGECSVSAVIKNIDPDDPDAAYFRFDPVTARNLNKLDCTPRAYFLYLTPSTPVHIGDDPHEDATLGDMGLLDQATQDDAGVASLFEFYGTAVGETTEERGKIAVAFCRGADGRGAPMRFNPIMNPGSDWLQVTQVAAGDWLVRTQPFPNNKAWCEHHLPDGGTIELLLHLDVEYTFTETP